MESESEVLAVTRAAPINTGSRKANFKTRYQRARDVTQRRLTTQHSFVSKVLPRKIRTGGRGTKKFFPGRPDIDYMDGKRLYLPQQAFADELYTEWGMISTWAYWTMLHSITFLVPYFQSFPDKAVRTECLENVAHFFDHLLVNKLFAYGKCKESFTKLMQSLPDHSTRSLVFDEADHYAFAKWLHRYHCYTKSPAQEKEGETFETAYDDSVLPFDKVRRHYEEKCVPKASASAPTVIEMWLKAEFKIDIVRDFQNAELVRVLLDPKNPQNNMRVLNFNYVKRILNYYGSCNPNGYWKAAWRRPRGIKDSNALFETDFRMLLGVDFVVGVLLIMAEEMEKKMASLHVVDDDDDALDK